MPPLGVAEEKNVSLHPPQTSGAPHAPAPPRQSRPWRIFGRAALAACAQRRRQALVLPLVTIILGTALLLVVPRRYTSDASFIVEQTESGALPASVIGMLGQLAGDGEGDASPQFYASLAQSRPILDALLAMRPVSVCTPSDTGSLLQRLDPSGDTPNERFFYGRKILAKRIGSDVELRTGTVTLSLEARCPSLAKELLDSLVAQINFFNVEKRQTRVKLRRKFLEGRLEDAKTRLNASEDRLTAFLSENRSVESPKLKLVMDRLERDISMNQDLETSIQREYEMARVEEINATPAVTLVVPPGLPVEASFPKRRIVFALLVILAFITSPIAILGRSLYQSDSDATPPAVRRLREQMGRWSFLKIPQGHGNKTSAG